MAYLYSKVQQKQFQRNANQMASSAYLGSFLSRATYLPADSLRFVSSPVRLLYLLYFLRDVVKFILHWCVTYINSHPSASPDAVVHGLFYSMSQSLYYIFCFHHTTLVSESNTEVLKAGYKQMTESKLNPLKVGPSLPSFDRESCPQAPSF